MNENKVIW